MEMLLIFILCTAGISWIVVHGEIFWRFRDAVKQKSFISNKNNRPIHVKWAYSFLAGLVTCMGCMGVWAGFISYVLVYQSVSPITIAYALSGAIISLIAKRLIK